MKTRLTALAAAAFSLAVLTGCGAGGGSGDTPAYEPPAPTVTVTAPATAQTGTGFTVAWTSANTSACSSNFSSSTDTNGTATVTESDAGTKTYTVTCTVGTSASATGSATVVVTTAPTPEGAWQGTRTSDSGTVSGVITKEGDYWLAYAPSGTVQGFYTGHAVSTGTSDTAGTIAQSNLLELNFAGGFSGGGNAAAGTLDAGVFTAKVSVSGEINPGAGLKAVFDNITSTGFVGTPALQYTNDTGTSVGSTVLNGNTLTIKMHTLVAINPATSGGVTDSAYIDSDDVFTGTFSGGVFTPTGGQSTVTSCTPITPADASNQVCSGAAVGTPVPFAPSSGPAYGGTVDITTGGTLFNRRPATGPINRRTDYVFPAPTTVSLLPAIPVADAFSLPTYNADYETTPVLADLAGNYTGSAGVGVALNGATFDIASDGTINGSGGGCDYSGNAVAHPSGGNFYDVTLTFIGCSYSTKGTFYGVAQYDATLHQVTVMAINYDSATNTGTQDTGFLFTGTKP